LIDARGMTLNPPSLWIRHFDWGGIDVPSRADLARLPGSPDLLCTLDGRQGCLRLHTSVAPPGAGWIGLSPMLTLPGAAAGEPAPYHYVVATDVAPQAEADLNAWYDTEHLPGLAAVPGTVAAMRHSSTGSPRYYASYDLARLDTFGSPAWLAVRATPWSARVRPQFRQTRRTMYRRVDPAALPAVTTKAV
jgi:hypothetical protein